MPDTPLWFADSKLCKGQEMRNRTFWKWPRNNFGLGSQIPRKTKPLIVTPCAAPPGGACAGFGGSVPSCQVKCVSIFDSKQLWDFLRWIPIMKSVG